MPRDKGTTMAVAEMCRRQGVPDGFLARIDEHGAFTASAKRRGIGNGVPLAMGRAVAKAVKLSLASAQQTTAQETP